MILRLALRELRHTGRKLSLIVFILFIGFIGPFFSSSLRSSVKSYLAERSRQILSADIAISSLKPFSKSVRDDLLRQAQPIRQVESTEFVTMAKGRGVATLVDVKGIDPQFPIYGSFQLQGSPSPVDASALSAEKVAWVFPEVLAQLGLQVGDSIGLGKSEFRIVGVLDDAPGVARAGGFAPGVYVGRKFVDETGLTQFGAQIFHRLYLQLAAGKDPENTEIIYKDPDVFIRTPDDSVQGFERFFKFFNLYLVTITMIVFVLSWTSAFYILQIFLQERLKNAAVFMINGGDRLRAGGLYAVQVFLIMAGAFVVAGLCVQTIAAVANQVFKAQLPPGFVMRVPSKDWLTLAGITLLSSLAFNAPFFVRLRLLRLQTLLGENALGAERLPPLTVAFAYVPLLLLFFLISTWLMGSFVEALRLAGGMILAAGVGWFAGRALFRGLFALVRRRPGYFRLVATALARSRFGLNLCFLALVLVALSLNLVPHLLTSVVTEIRPLQGREVPALFLFNIPESMLEKVKALADQRDFELRYLSPMVLARLLNVNGKEAEESQLQRFPVRLSYRDTRIPSETLVAGRDLPGAFVPGNFTAGAEVLPEVSVEMRFAQRNALKLGDILEFDVQSVPIRARVSSLRAVKWTTFNPNFFIMFQTGVLDDAPKSWIANINLRTIDEAKAAEQKVRLQYELTRDFPDISVIDIGRTIARVLQVAQSVIGPVRIAAWTAVAMSFLILLGVILHNLRLRDGEIDIAKLLGADSALIRRLLVGEYALTALFAWMVGAGASLIIAWTVARQALDIPLRISWDALLWSAVATIVTTIVIAYFSASRVLLLRGASRKL